MDTGGRIGQKRICVKGDLSAVKAITKATMSDGRVGYSWCSMKDKWNKDLGINIAWGRAMEMEKIQKDLNEIHRNVM